MALRDFGYGKSLLVILGAGASFDSLPRDVADRSSPNCTMPPLTKDLAGGSGLANELVQKYADAGPLIDELRTRLSASPNRHASDESMTLERAMGEYLALADTDSNVRRHIAAMRYYLRDLLWLSAESVLQANGGITNYTSLVRNCYQWATMNDRHVCFVSFNYDHLLERACQYQFGFDPTSPTCAMTNERASLLKPHGSVLWQYASLRTRVTPLSENIWQQAIQVGEPDPSETLSLSATLPPQDWTSGPNDPGVIATLPALALPITGKTELVWPGEQDDFFRNQITNGSFGHVAIIGWRAAETHFTTLLDRLIPNRARMLVVTGGTNAEEDSATVLENLSSFSSRVERIGDCSGFRAMDLEKWEWVLGGNY
jgi:hypothetical protein